MPEKISQYPPDVVELLTLVRARFPGRVTCTVRQYQEATGLSLDACYKQARGGLLPVIRHNASTGTSRATIMIRLVDPEDGEDTGGGNAPSEEVVGRAANV